MQVLYLSASVKDLRSNGASGDLTAKETLDRLLSGTGLTYRYVDPNAVTLLAASAKAPQAAAPRPATDETEGKSDSSDVFRLAQADRTAGEGPAPVEAAPDPPSRLAKPLDSLRQLKTVEITGTHILAPNLTSQSPITEVNATRSRIRAPPILRPYSISYPNFIKVRTSRPPITPPGPPI